MCLCMTVCGYVLPSAGAHRNQNVSDPLGLELLASVSCLIVVLGTKLSFSRGAACALKQWMQHFSGS